MFEFTFFIIFYVIVHVGQGQGVNGIEPELLVVELFEKRNIFNLAAFLVDLIFKIWIYCTWDESFLKVVCWKTS